MKAYESPYRAQETVANDLARTLSGEERVTIGGQKALGVVEARIPALCVSPRDRYLGGTVHFLLLSSCQIGSRKRLRWIAGTGITMMSARGR
jgi:hypothetical protein